MDRANVLGIVAQKGGYTSHSAIIARGWGIPAVLGIPNIMSCVSSGDTIVLDAIAGNLHSRAHSAGAAKCRCTATMFMEQKSISDKFLYAPGRTLDGVPVEIGLNVGKCLRRRCWRLSPQRIMWVCFVPSFFIWNQTICPRKRSSLQLIKRFFWNMGAPGDSADAGYRWG